MSGAAASSPSGAYLVMLAEDHASARGFKFDEPARTELRKVADGAIYTAHSAGIFTVEDILPDVAPNTILFTNAIIDFADGFILRVHSIKQGLSKICPIFPFC